jgi:DNA replication protein DnaC
MLEELGFGVSREEGPCGRCGGEGGGTLSLPGGGRVALLCGPCREASDAEDAAEARARRTERALERAGRDARMRDWSLVTYPKDAAGLAAQRVAAEWLDGYRAGERRNLILHGGVGGGKTGLAWGMVRSLIELDEVDALLVNFRQLLSELRQTFQDRQQGLPIDYARAHRVPVLALDDVGAERPTDFAREELALVVEERYSYGRPTIVTSNYAPGDLIRRLGHDDVVIGQRIVSRLTENAVQYEVKARDRRLG